MNNKIANFILQWRYELRIRKTNKSKWRKIIASHFRDNEKYKIGEWTTDEFLKTWNELEELKMIYI